MLTVQSEWLRLRLELDPLRWSLERTDAKHPSIKGSSIAVNWRAGSEKRSWSGRLLEAQTATAIDADDVQGPVRWLTVEGILEDSNVTIRLGLGLSQSLPMMLIRAELENTGPDPIQLDSLELLRVGHFGQARWSRFWSWLTANGGQSPADAPSSLQLGKQDVDLAWFANGWQSWSFAGSLDQQSPLTGTRLGPLTSPMYLNPATGSADRRANRTSDMFAVLGDRNARVGILCGQLAERSAFCSIRMQIEHPGEIALRMQADLDGVALPPGRNFVVDRAGIQLLDLSQERPLDAYVAAVARENGARVPDQVPTGWSSWYYFFDTVSEADVVDNLEWMAARRDQVPLGIVQLDDGYQPMVGDWLKVNKRFPHGHRWLVDQIQANGFQAGLWLAPFIAHPRSSIVRNHPDWVLRSSGGRPVRAGYNWNTFVVALDLTHPGVIDYVQTVVKTAVQTWGYRFLKLDFLYAGALPGRRHDPTMTRAQALHSGLLAIRQAAGESTMLAGCGSPLGPAVGLVDTMRIGPDVAPRWRPAYQGIEAFFQREPSLPAARNAARNTLARAPMHNRWWINDPDCLLLRKTDTHLGPAEVQFVATVSALSGGALFVSDDMPRLTSERVRWLRRLLPPLTGQPVVPDWLDRTQPRWLRLDLEGAVGRWCLLAVLNWDRQTKSMAIHLDDVGLDPDLEYDAADSWNEVLLPPIADGSQLEVPGHGVRLLRLTPKSKEDRPSWLGDTFHISGGSSVVSWQADTNAIRIGLTAEYPLVGRAWIWTPGLPTDAKIDNGRCSWTRAADDIIELDVEVDEGATVVVRWDPRG